MNYKIRDGFSKSEDFLHRSYELAITFVNVSKLQFFFSF